MLIIIPLLRFNPLLPLNNSLVLKIFLVKSIEPITPLIRLIFYLDFLMKNLYSCCSFFWKVGLVFIFILPFYRFRGFQRGAPITCLSLLKMSVKKNISNNVFRGQKYSDSHIGLYTLSIRIRESAPPHPAGTNFDCIGFTAPTYKTY